MTVGSRSPGRKMRLGELLVAAGVLDEARLQAALAEQKKWGGKLGRTLVDMGLLSEELMVKALSRQLGIQESRPDVDPLPPDVSGWLGVQFCERYGVIPVARDDQKRVLSVATSDPTNEKDLAEIGLKVGYRILPVVASAPAIDRAIRRYYYGEQIEIPVREAAPPRGSAPPPPQPTYAVAPTAQASPPPPWAKPAPPPPPPWAAQQPPPPPWGAPQPQSQELDQLRAQVDRVEKVLAGEVRALRALVESLIDRGLLSREEYIARVRRE